MHSAVLDIPFESAQHRSLKDSLLYLYTIAAPLFVFAVAFGRDTLAVWVVGGMVLVFLFDLVTSFGRVWVDRSFLPLAFLALAYVAGTLRIYLEEPAYSWLGRTPLDRALTVDLRFVFVSVSFVMFVHLLADAPRKTFERILMLQLTVGLVIAGIGLVQYAAYQLWGIGDLLRVEPTNESFFARSNIFRLGRHRVFRSTAFFNEPSYFGFFLVPLIMKAIVAWGQRQSIGYAGVLGTMVVVFALAVLSNMSFTAVLSLVVLALLFAAVSWRGPNRRVIQVLLGSAVVIVVALLAMPFGDVLLERISRVVELKDASTLDRIFRVYSSTLVAIDHPLLGVGPGGYAFFYPRMGGLDLLLMASPLNVWLSFLTDVGLIGFGAFVAFLVVILRRGFGALRRDPLVSVYLWSVISYLVLLTTLDFWFLEMFWFEAAMLVVLTARATGPGRREVMANA